MEKPITPMRNFTFRIDWLINDDWEPRFVKVALPASDCATDEQRDKMTAYAAGGLA